MTQVEEHRTQLPSQWRLLREAKQCCLATYRLVQVSLLHSLTDHMRLLSLYPASDSVYLVLWYRKDSGTPIYRYTHTYIYKHLYLYLHTHLQLRLSDWGPGQPRPMVRTRGFWRASILQSRRVSSCARHIKPYQGRRRDLHLQVCTTDSVHI